jgi:DNA-binding transcriptional ArsR family regulator
MKRLRAEVDSLKEQLIRISKELGEDSEDVTVVKEEPYDEMENQESTKEESKEFTSKVEYDDEDLTSSWSRRIYPHNIRFEKRFEERFGNYIEDFVEDVMDGVASGLENTLFVHSRPRPRPYRRGRKLGSDEIKTTADAMSALSNEHRIKILDELSYGGMYASDFHQVLPEISPSTLSSHLDVLEKTGFIVQERRRGRYVISLPGRLAVKMAHQVAKRVNKEF